LPGASVAHFFDIEGERRRQEGAELDNQNSDFYLKRGDSRQTRVTREMRKEGRDRCSWGRRGGGVWGKKHVSALVERTLSD